MRPEGERGEGDDAASVDCSADFAELGADATSHRLAADAGASGGGFVEIGVFTTSDKAAAASARLAAAGFPVQAANVTHRGQSVQRLRVGPYGTDVAVKAALAAVHRSGYTQAYVR